MAVPVYLFLVVYRIMIVTGLVRAFIDGPTPFTQTAPAATQPLALFLLLRALGFRQHRPDRHRSHQQRRAGI